MKHLPERRDWDHMDRKWLSDILNTVDRVKFEKMPKKGRIDSRRSATLW
jgi:hypothetical protein